MVVPRVNEYMDFVCVPPIRSIVSFGGEASTVSLFETLAHPWTGFLLLVTLFWLGVVTTAMVLLLEAFALENISASGTGVIADRP